MSGPDDWYNSGDPGPDNSDGWWHQMDLEVRRYLEELTKRGIRTETTKETENDRPELPEL